MNTYFLNQNYQQSNKVIKFGLSQKLTKSKKKKIFLMVLANQLIYLVNVKTMRKTFFQLMSASQKVRTLKEVKYFGFRPLRYLELGLLTDSSPGSNSESFLYVCCVLLLYFFFLIILQFMLEHEPLLLDSLVQNLF